MELYPPDAAEKLSFQFIRESLAQRCLTEEAKAWALALLPFTDTTALLLELQQVQETVALLAAGEQFPLSALPAIGALLAKASVNGNYISEEEAFRFLRWLTGVRKVKAYLEGRRESYPALAKLLADSDFNTDFIHQLEQVIGPDGHLLSTASTALQQLRRSQIERSTTIRRLLEQVLRRARDNGWAEGRELTLRNERLVIPVLADFKNKVPGFIHDISQSGQTVYLEPVEALQANNELQELRLQEQHEIVRLLRQLTDQLRTRLAHYHHFLWFISQVDMLLAKAKLAHQLVATLPALHATGDFYLHQGRHPVLLLQKGAAAVVPITLKLTAEKRLLVISGPNAGGKSVAMKTAGLLQLMLQSGLLVPVHPDSSFRLFDQLFVEIGDDQSLQNDLSTYSSHLQHMRVLLERLNSSSLYLIDELGTGTDPQLGGPIAEAILEQLVQRGAMGIITTHFSNLKEFAQQEPAAVNAAMQFDSSTLQPTYKLEQGVPGSSYALEMAQRAGIPPAVVASARQKIGEERADAETVLHALRQERDTFAQLVEQNRQQQEALKEQLAAQRGLAQEAEAKRKRILLEARAEATHLLKEANAKIEETIRRIREEQADKTATKTLRKELQDALLISPQMDEEWAAAEEGAATGLVEDLATAVQVGDQVRLLKSDAVGTVLERNGKRLVVAMGELRSNLKLEQVVKLGRQAPPITARLSPLNAVVRNTRAHHELDLRGMRVEAALKALDKFMDEATLAGLHLLVLLHGKGSGALRNAVRTHLLQNYPQVKSVADGPADGPGAGITVVELNS